ncbi:hypothetical protein ACFL5Z_02400 [Planctomycetota bacterium]
MGLIQDEDLLLTEYGWVEEVSISLRDVPRPVRATIKKHAAGGKIIEIERNSTGGTTVYEAEIVRNGKVFDILVSSAGKFLGIEEEETESDETTEDTRIAETDEVK